MGGGVEGGEDIVAVIQTLDLEGGEWLPHPGVLHYPLKKRLNSYQRRSGCFEKENNLMTLQGIKARILIVQSIA